jgi:hypothetical protein
MERELLSPEPTAITNIEFLLDCWVARGLKCKLVDFIISVQQQSRPWFVYAAVLATISACWVLLVNTGVRSAIPSALMFLSLSRRCVNVGSL